MYIPKKKFLQFIVLEKDQAANSLLSFFLSDINVITLWRKPRPGRIDVTNREKEKERERGIKTRLTRQRGDTPHQNTHTQSMRGKEMGIN